MLLAAAKEVGFSFYEKIVYLKNTFLFVDFPEHRGLVQTANE